MILLTAIEHTREENTGTGDQPNADLNTSDKKESEEPKVLPKTVVLETAEAWAGQEGWSNSNGWQWELVLTALGEPINFEILLLLNHTNIIKRISFQRGKLCLRAFSSLL